MQDFTQPAQPTPEPSPTPLDNNAKMWGMLCHLSALAGFVVPFGNLIGPLVV